MEYLLKASAVIALIYLCFLIFLKKETFFQYNRWFLLTGLALALIFPLIVIPVYIPVEPIVNETTTFISSTPSNFVTTPTEVAFNWFKLIPILYSIGLIAFTVQFIFQFGSLILLLLKNPKHTEQRFTYVIVDKKISPFSFFKWIVYNPESYETEELQLILTHEKVHVNQWHSIDIICTQLACILFWFNPLIWLYKKEVRQNLEYIADSKTQSLTNTTKEYQHLLLKTSVANSAIILSNNFYNSSIKKRILMLNKSRSKKNNKYKYLLILPLFTGLLMSMNTETFYVEAQNNTIKNNNTIDFNGAITSTKTSTSTESIKVKFTKTMSDESLDKMKTWLKSKKVTMTIKHVKRNSKSEISNLNIDFKTENGTTNYHVKDKYGIAPFEFKMDDDGSFGVEVVENIDYVYEELIFEALNPNSDLQHNSYDSDSLEVIVEDSIYFKSRTPKYKTSIRKVTTNEISKDTIYISMDSLEIKSQINKKSDFYYEDGSQPKIISEEVIIHNSSNKAIYNSHFDSQNPKPLIIVNGKPATSEYLKTIEPNDIESVEVLKGESAIATYGDKGENGVIIIKLKDENSEPIKVDAKGKNPWRVEISGTSYFDTDDPTKGGTLAYITKLTPDGSLDQHILNLKKVGITLNFSKLKRNKSGEIISIKINLENEKGAKSSANWEVEEGIPNLEFGEMEGSLIVRTSDMN